jgi:membrane protease subunit HflK
MSRPRTKPVVFQGLEAGLKLFRWIVLVLTVLFCVSGVQTVTKENVGLLLRFGRLQGASLKDQVKSPGLVLAFPHPIDRLIQVPVKEEGEVLVDEVWKGITGMAAIDKIDPLVEGYCLTGDQNIVQAKLVAKYRIDETTGPIRFRLWMDEPEGLLRNVVLAALTQTTTGWEVDDVLRLQRSVEGQVGSTESLADTVKRRAQARLDALDSGMIISAIEFKEIHPPRHVVAEFRDVQNARIDMETQQREAEGFAKGRLPAAQAEADRLIKAATAYETSLVATTNAELSVFTETYEQYRKNPALVSKRIAMETFEQIMQDVGNAVFASPGTRVILPNQEAKRD